jgi:protocatechuate 3,4-dioxygenase beta subunit
MNNKNISRRKILGSGIVVGVASVATAASAGEKKVTPGQTEGPFYPIKPQEDLDADLTRVTGANGVAEGEVIIVEGHVYDENGAPLADALVDVWQANAYGRYAHEKDPNTAPLDPNFQGWAKVVTNAEGRYRYKTIKPKEYAAMGEWVRPAHIHYKVSKLGYHEVTTQMYFENEPLNEKDEIFLGTPEGERHLLVSRDEVVEGDPDTTRLCRFDVTLKAV